MIFLIKKLKIKNYFLIFSFLLCLFFQIIFLPSNTIIDQSMWANQALYFQNGDERQYDFLQAYGHPGGPVIEGTIILQKNFNINYEDSVYYLLILFNSFIIAFIVYLIFLWRKSLYFVMTTFLILGFHRFYPDLTPTSYIASLIFVLQAFYSLYLYENREKLKFKDILGFSFLAGLIMATRIDIGFIGTLFFGIYLLPKITMRDFIYAIFLILGSFVLFNPYMWYMPFQHISDLAYKFIYHYQFFTDTKISLLDIFSLSIFILLSLLAFLFLYFNNKKLISINLRFFYVVIILSFFLYLIFLSSKINTIRYMAPIIILWEILFPFLVLDLLKLKNKFFLQYKKSNFEFLFKILIVILYLYINLSIIFIIL
jgi:hypothetical protein